MMDCGHREDALTYDDNGKYACSACRAESLAQSGLRRLIEGGGFPPRKPYDGLISIEASGETLGLVQSWKPTNKRVTPIAELAKRGYTPGKGASGRIPCAGDGEHGGYIPVREGGPSS